MSDDGPRIDPYAVTAPATNGSAIWSVVLAGLGFVCLYGLGGLLGIALGLMARAEIERSGGRSAGKSLANAGIALGALNIVACVAAFGALIAYAARPAGAPSRYAAPAYTAAAPAPTPTPTATAAAPRPGGAVPARGGASRDNGVVVTHIDKLELVDVGPDVGSLRSTLDAQRAAAEKDRKQLLLWVVVKDCKPCNGVAVSLSDPVMQRALEGVRIIRIDANDFVLELQHLHVPLDKTPGFALLGSDDRPVDYVHGGEWDADIPRNIAPVLGRFVRGTYSTRRDPWHGGRRDDETSL